MKAICVSALMVVALAVPSAIADSTEISGTWSGSWIPEGSIRDSVTVEIEQDGNGNIKGRFATPADVRFSLAKFNPQTRTLVVEARDEKSGELYKLNARLTGAELTGTLERGAIKGTVHLIKWTYVPRYPLTD
jgi:hypothetical protein